MTTTIKFFCLLVCISIFGAQPTFAQDSSEEDICPPGSICDDNAVLPLLTSYLVKSGLQKHNNELKQEISANKDTLEKTLADSKRMEPLQNHRTLKATNAVLMQRLNGVITPEEIVNAGRRITQLQIEGRIDEAAELRSQLVTREFMPQSEVKNRIQAKALNRERSLNEEIERLEKDMKFTDPEELKKARKVAKKRAKILEARRLSRGNKLGIAAEAIMRADLVFAVLQWFVHSKGEPAYYFPGIQTAFNFTVKPLFAGDLQTTDMSPLYNNLSQSADQSDKKD